MGTPIFNASIATKWKLHSAQPPNAIDERKSHNNVDLVVVFVREEEEEERWRDEDEDEKEEERRDCA